MAPPPRHGPHGNEAEADAEAELTSISHYQVRACTRAGSASCPLPVLWHAWSACAYRHMYCQQGSCAPSVAARRASRAPLAMS